MAIRCREKVSQCNSVNSQNGPGIPNDGPTATAAAGKPYKPFIGTPRLDTPPADEVRHPSGIRRHEVGQVLDIEDHIGGFFHRKSFKSPPDCSWARHGMTDAATAMENNVRLLRVRQRRCGVYGIAIRFGRQVPCQFDGVVGITRKRRHLGKEGL